MTPIFGSSDITPAAPAGASPRGARGPVRPDHELVVLGTRLVMVYTHDPCVGCGKPIQSGQLYIRMVAGPFHLGCDATERRRALPRTTSW